MYSKMPVTFTIAQSYLDDHSEETDETRIFNPRESTDAEFREFMVVLFLQQKKENGELARKLTVQTDLVNALNQTINTLERENNRAHTHRDAEMEEIKTENRRLKGEIEDLKSSVDLTLSRNKCLNMA